jgi:hypothetical protein
LNTPSYVRDFPSFLQANDWNYSFQLIHVHQTVQCDVTYIDDKGKDAPVLFLTEHHAMKAYWGSRGIAPRILDLGSRWR